MGMKISVKNWVTRNNNNNSQNSDFFLKKRKEYHGLYMAYLHHWRLLNEPDNQNGGNCVFGFHFNQDEMNFETSK